MKLNVLALRSCHKQSFFCDVFLLEVIEISYQYFLLSFKTYCFLYYLHP